MLLSFIIFEANLSPPPPHPPEIPKHGLFTSLRGPNDVQQAYPTKTKISNWLQLRTGYVRDNAARVLSDQTVKGLLPCLVLQSNCSDVAPTKQQLDDSAHRIATNLSYLLWDALYGTNATK